MKMSQWFSDPFLNRLMLYVFSVSLILGVWTHYEEEKDAVENPKKNKGGKQTVINSDGTIKTPELLQKAANSKKPAKYS